MTNDYRQANRIVLLDHYTVLAAPGADGGIFQDFEVETWRIDQQWITRLLKAMGIQVPALKEYESGYHIEVERIPAHTGTNIYPDAERKGIGNISKIEASILGANLIDLRLTWNAGTKEEFTRQVTYSGGFTVEWSAF